jgi:RNA polymerase sigma-70 factor (ECF subfamily)
MDFEKLHREESGRILSTLIGLLGDFDLAEEMLQEAYATAIQKWPADGVPANPRAWLVSTARNKAIDRLRRDRRFDTKREEIWPRNRPFNRILMRQTKCFPMTVCD